MERATAHHGRRGARGGGDDRFYPGRKDHLTRIAQTEEVSASASAHQATLARAEVLCVQQAAAVEAGEIRISLRTELDTQRSEFQSQPMALTREFNQQMDSVQALGVIP